MMDYKAILPEKGSRGGLFGDSPGKIWLLVAILVMIGTMLFYRYHKMSAFRTADVAPIHALANAPIPTSVGIC